MAIRKAGKIGGLQVYEEVTEIEQVKVFKIPDIDDKVAKLEVEIAVLEKQKTDALALDT